MKLNTVNVIELQTNDNVVESIRSFNTTTEGVKAAEKLFTKLCMENTRDAKGNNTLCKEDIDAALEDGYFEEGSFKVVIQWS